MKKKVINNCSSSQDSQNFKTVLLAKGIMKGERNHSSSSNQVMMRIIIFFISCYTNILVESKKNDGFSTELIHINSPLSPFFNSNLTHQGYIKQIGSSILAHESVFYLMKISYGKPPTELYHIVDTASDLSWIQCLPCTHCYDSEYAPFNPRVSCTFEFQNCPYEMVYKDNSYSRGELAKETITVGSGSHKREFKDFLFGCGHYNTGSFPHKGAGIVGFNRKERSFITQLRTKHHGAFSYCMAPPGSTNAGRISFGHEAIVLGNNVMTTPLILDSYYNIMLTGISVGNKKLKYFPDSYSSSNDSKGKNFQLQLIIDSGSNAIYLSNSFYSEVEKTIIKNIHGKTPIGRVNKYKLCYSSSLTDAHIPRIKLHLPGVILEMNPYNIFLDVVGRRCLAILASNNTYILGNMAQMNFLIGFDLVEKILSFKPTNCDAL